MDAQNAVCGFDFRERTAFLVFASSNDASSKPENDETDYFASNGCEMLCRPLKQVSIVLRVDVSC